VPRLVARLVTPLVADYFASAVRLGASACRAARRRLLRLCHASRCLGMSCGSSRRSSSTTPPHTGSSSTTPPHTGLLSTTSPRHVVGLVTWLVVDNFTSATRPSASARHAGSSLTTSPPPRVRVPRHVERLITRLDAPLIVDYSTSRRLVVDDSASCRLVVDYFASSARTSASPRRAAHHAAHRAASRRLLHVAQACH
jgi:hypothetical protein